MAEKTKMGPGLHRANGGGLVIRTALSFSPDKDQNEIQAIEAAAGWGMATKLKAWIKAGIFFERLIDEIQAGAPATADLVLKFYKMSKGNEDEMD